ncbi:MAG: 30S ribosomal protein S15 [Planctomycetota bacterium]
MISSDKKNDAIKTTARHDSDTGSAEVQISILTARIAEVAEHLRQHKHDKHGRRGLVMMVGRRNRLLRYLARTDRDRYLETIKKLGLRK